MSTNTATTMPIESVHKKYVRTLVGLKIFPLTIEQCSWSEAGLVLSIGKRCLLEWEKLPGTFIFKYHSGIIA